MATDGKIDTLNRCLGELVVDLRSITDPDLDVQLVVVAFGGHGASVHVGLTSVETAELSPLVAVGQSRLGAAIELAAQILADASVVPSSSYAPLLVLLSDGRPTDGWEAPLRALEESDAAARSTRFAVAIGGDADRYMLEQFAGPTGQVVTADRVDDISRFFRYLSWVAGAGVSGAEDGDSPLTPYDDFALGELEY